LRRPQQAAAHLLDGGDQVEPGEDILNNANIPTYKYPDTAARAFYYMYRYSYNLRGLYETRPGSSTISRRSQFCQAKRKPSLKSFGQRPHNPDGI